MTIFADKKKLQEDLAAAQASLASITQERDDAKAALKETSDKLESANASVASITAERDASKVAADKAIADLKVAQDALVAEQAKTKTVEDAAAYIAVGQVAAAGFPAEKLPAEPNGNPSGAQSDLLTQYHSLKGAERMAFLRKHKAALLKLDRQNAANK